MSQYGQQAAYGQGQQGQIGGQAQMQMPTDPSQYSAQDPSQPDPAQYGGQNASQQDPSQYAGQSPSQQDPQQAGQISGSYGGQTNGMQQNQGGADATNQNSAQSQQAAQPYQQSKNGGFPSKQGQGIHDRDPKKGMYSNAMSKPIQGGMMGAASGMMGGAQDQNQVAPQSNLRGRNYHPSHLNALHHMGKAASEYL